MLTSLLARHEIFYPDNIDFFLLILAFSMLRPATMDTSRRRRSRVERFAYSSKLLQEAKRRASRALAREAGCFTFLLLAQSWPILFSLWSRK